jgi:uncharacterized protein YcaQ
VPRVTELIPLSNTPLRRIWARAQRLDTSEPFGESAPAIADAVDHLSDVQTDTINAIERAAITISSSPRSGPAKHRQERVRTLDACAE